jgi:predicted nucleic acid-binding protein
MPRAIFETRFFVYFFASSDPETHRKLLTLMERFRPRLISPITLFEIYKLSLEREGKEVAEARTAHMRKEFEVVPVTDSIAIRGAQLKHAAKVQSNEDIPMADSLIAATSLLSKAVCVTGSPRFDEMPQVKRKWI